jgi:hypothetical protein
MSLPNTDTDTSTAPPIDESKFSPEQRLSLEQARAENTASQLELAKLQQRGREAEAEHTALLKSQAMRDGIEASSVKFYDVGLASMLAEKDYDLRFSEDGATGLLDGKRVPLAKIYQHIALVAHPTIADQRSTRALKPDADAPASKAKSQMSMQEKMSYIDKFGDAAWAKVPMYPMKTLVVRTREDFMSLPIRQRMDLQAQNGENWLAHLPREPKQRNF